MWGNDKRQGGRGEMRLNNYDCSLTRDSMKVGCQTFRIADIDALISWYVKERKRIQDAEWNDIVVGDLWEWKYERTRTFVVVREKNEITKAHITVYPVDNPRLAFGTTPECLTERITELGINRKDTEK
jgi:hypothetical protein